MPCYMLRITEWMDRKDGLGTPIGQKGPGGWGAVLPPVKTPSQQSVGLKAVWGCGFMFKVCNLFFVHYSTYNSSLWLSGCFLVLGVTVLSCLSYLSCHGISEHVPPHPFHRWSAVFLPSREKHGLVQTTAVRFTMRRAFKLISRS